MKKRFKLILRNSNPSLNSTDESAKPKPTENVNSPSAASKNIPVKLVKSSSEQVIGKTEASSQHEDIRRKYKSATEKSASCDSDLSERTETTDTSGFSEEVLDVFDAQSDQMQSPTSGMRRQSSVPFTSNFPWLARNNRSSLARREANSIIVNVKLQCNFSVCLYCIGIHYSLVGR